LPILVQYWAAGVIRWNFDADDEDVDEMARRLAQE